LCRREKVKLFLKGDRCYSGKCAVEKRPTAPGQHGKNHVKLSEYGIRMREKQKAKRIYGMNEGQFRRFFAEAARKPGVTGEYLFKLLESRLDNVIYRCGFAPSRNSARQMVLHGHILVNEKKVNVPSFIVKPRDVVRLRDKSKEMTVVKANIVKVKERGVLSQISWMDIDLDKLQVTFNKLPEKSDIGTFLDDQLIVEYYK
jgi:small subunit ribosomal protein S4